ncbi:MAG: heme ABC transporter permease [Phototrophicales bacterium]|nr:MAG: heme ABC transporter permease [Phototrophicales bacterium]
MRATISQERNRLGWAIPTSLKQSLYLYRSVVVLVALCLMLVIITIVAAGTGAVEISPRQVIGILLDEVGIHTDISFEERQRVVLMIIRLPRVVMGVLIGASLAVSGTAIQGLFRNPLADPGLIGISSGAALATAIIIVLGSTTFKSVTDLLGAQRLPISAFVGGILTTLLIYRLSTVGGHTHVATMLLAGIAINAIAGAGIGMMIFIATDEQLRDITFWSLGSLGRASWDNIKLLLPFLAISLLPLPFSARALNTLLLGESEASHLGIHVERVKAFVIISVALSVGAGVAVTGIIGFIGLVVPHLLRLMVGPDHRVVLPGSALLGASLLVGADLVARTVAVPAEVPIGIVTALIGGPFFLYLLIRDRGRNKLL